ncbi:hypothetical protein GUITHDRAFT_161590 [Guillardia theta CCMP2712]|uniref:Pentacotripeptide-repeat region of PRORP domain-containing protein n=1 Tax=Guillardia theta (strain CCMP2712) TaxID=905079 RepID=L1JTC1_GUITC|nr:hypothetical protein GUITHDRAFT_161590 [Guillardia theta CCMP2712]EKX51687.1 hypothetical protein GUITHDRAFT_161590 [Guillardia theta CCMP2712]|eukprot:XP_005838667.1 hypothetical protein GUITHDRAFT_161590 [Guillardia theta CCMP2712]
MCRVTFLLILVAQGWSSSVDVSRHSSPAFAWMPTNGVVLTPIRLPLEHAYCSCSALLGSRLQLVYPRQSRPRGEIEVRMAREPCSSSKLMQILQTASSSPTSLQPTSFSLANNEPKGEPELTKIAMEGAGIGDEARPHKMGWRDGEMESEFARLAMAVEEGYTPDLTSFNRALLLCSRAVSKGLGSAALQRALCILALMNSAQVSPDRRSFCLLLEASVGAALQGNRVAIRCSLTIIRNMYSVGLMPDLLLTNQLVNKMLKSSKNISEAYIEAFDLTQGMRRAGMKLDMYTYNSLIAACSQQNERGLERAIEILKLIREDELEPDMVTYNALLHVCAKSAQHLGRRAVDLAQHIFSLMQATDNLKPSVITYNALMHASGLAACSSGEDAIEMLQGMVAAFKEMLARGVKPDQKTFSTVLHGLARGIQFIVLNQPSNKQRGNTIDPKQLNLIIESAEEILWKMDEEGVAPQLSNFRMMLLIYAKSSARLSNRDWLESSLKLLEDMRNRGLVPCLECYTSLMEVCSSMAGRANCTRRGFWVALDLLAELQGAGHIPTSFLYILIFNAARKDGSEEAVDLALGLFLSLSESYKTKFVYTSIISALSAKGRGREAASLLEEAKLHGIVPDKVMYSVCTDASKATRPSDAGGRGTSRETPSGMVKKCRELEKDDRVVSEQVAAQATGEDGGENSRVREPEEK